MAKIPEGYVKPMCQPNTECACSFLIFGDGFECAKGTFMEKLIEERRRAGTMNAKGDNCSGPPDFILPDVLGGVQ